MDKAIAYYRVITQKQSASGLSQDARRTAVENYAASNDLTIVGAFTEVETGTNKRRRPKLEESMAAAKAKGAVLLIGV
jgi:DNA invertase Pin-like site-specific DNA recombinase